MCVLPPLNSILPPALPPNQLSNLPSISHPQKPPNCTPFLPQNNSQICPQNHPFKNPPFFCGPKITPKSTLQITPSKPPNCTHFLLRNSSQICPPNHPLKHPQLYLPIHTQNLPYLSFQTFDSKTSKKNYPILTSKRLEILP
jgi:hypothetical protein